MDPQISCANVNVAVVRRDARALLQDDACAHNFFSGNFPHVCQH
jgi:hypothetical protein